jgi:hypothetical protein
MTMVLEVLVQVSDNIPADVNIPYTDESIDTTERLLSFYSGTHARIKKACLDLLLNMSRVPSCAKHLIDSETASSQLISLLEDDNTDLVATSLKILNNLEKHKPVESHMVGEGEMKKIIDGG